ncbi:MAG: hypothetical protein ACQEW9_07695 [Bacteroidota bacterium]
MRDEQFISGIYNWCDRWCERCQFTSRCRAYDREESRKQANPDQDVWEAISESFKEALILLEKAAAEHGISLEISEEEKNSILEEENAKDEEVEKIPLQILADEYLGEGKNWLDSLALKEYRDRLQSQLEMGIISLAEGEEIASVLEDSLEVIQWYLFLIPVKVQRALRDKMDGFWDEYPIEERGDLGTAKIGMIAIERSLGAWAKIYQLIPEDDQVLRLLARLEKMRRLLKKEFPDYSKFKRPGFDDN